MGIRDFWTDWTRSKGGLMSVTNIEDALSIEIQVVDWEAMGEIFALQNSNDQAYFLVAFWSNVKDAQIPYIGNSGVFGKHNESTRQEVAEMCRELATQIENGGY